MSEHTPEPWETKGTRSDSVGREHIYICGQHINSGPVLTVCLVTGQMVGPAAQEANARRIAACVNACKGMTTEDLESGLLAQTLSEAHEAVSVAFTMLAKVRP